MIEKKTKNGRNMRIAKILKKWKNAIKIVKFNKKTVKKLKI